MPQGVTGVTLVSLSSTSYTSSSPTINITFRFNYVPPAVLPIMAGLFIYTTSACTTRAKSTSIAGVATEWDNYTSGTNLTRSVTLSLSGISNGTYYVRLEETSTGVVSVAMAVTINVTTAITISFDANGGSVTPSSINTTSGTSVTLPANAGTKTGYAFNKWKYGTTYYNGGGSYTFYSSLTLVADWTPVTYSITYDLNGGTGTNSNPTSYNITTSSIVFTALTDAYKKGYTFTGWLPTSIPQGSTGNKTIVAQWSINDYHITLDPTGGTFDEGATTEFDVTYGDEYGSAITGLTISRTGYSFLGWYTSLPSGTRIYPSTIMDKDYDHTLYAKWGIVNYSIYYDLAGGTHSGNPSTYTIASDEITLNMPTRTGYNFMGWTGTDLTEPTLVVTIPTGSMGTRYYTATWDPINYSVTFKPNGGAQLEYVQEFEYGTAENLDLMAFTRTGYSFVEWNTSVDGSGTSYADEASVLNLTNIDEGNVNLYAIWEINQYTVSFNSNGGSAVSAITQDYGTEVTEPTDPTRSGYTFADWYEDAALTIPVVWPYTLEDSNVTFYAKWTPIVYTISYTLNGGTHSGNPTTFIITDLPITLNNPTKTGYTGSWSPNPINTIGNKTIVASYTPIVYNITYVLNGGSHTGNPTTFTIEDLPISLNVPIKAGYTGSWNVNPITTIGDKTITASYTPITYSITYVLNGGSHTGNPTTFTIEDLPVSLNSPTKTGYTGSWDVNPVTTIGNKTITASYVPIVYTISYTLNGGSHTGNPTTFTIEDLPVSLNNPIKTGYTGTWSINPIVTIGNKSITASYTVITYTISYVLNGGSHVGNPVSYNIETPTITLNAPTKTGYVGSWSPSDSVPVGSIGNKVFTAVYVPIAYQVAFNKNSLEAEGSMSNQSCTYDLDFTVRTNTFIRPQYNFLGWALTADGAVVYTDAQLIEDNLTSVANATVTLYAKWRSRKVRISGTTPLKLMLETDEILKVYVEETVIWDKNQNN